MASGVRINASLICTKIDDTPSGGEQLRGGVTNGVPLPQYQWVSSMQSEDLYMQWGWGSGLDGWFSSYVWEVDGKNYAYNKEMVTAITP